MAVESTPAFVRLEGQQCQVFNEAAFKYFFELERARAARVNRPLLLLLVRVPGGNRPDRSAAPRLVSRMFAALTSCVRDADFVGWYREGSIAGAVLPVTGPICSSTRHALCARVVRTLQKSLPPGEVTHVSAHLAVVGQTPSV